MIKTFSISGEQLIEELKKANALGKVEGFIISKALISSMLIDVERDFYELFNDLNELVEAKRIIQAKKDSLSGIDKAAAHSEQSVEFDEVFEEMDTCKDCEEKSNEKPDNY